MKDSFYEELEHVFDKFPEYHMKILLEYFSAKVGREDFLNRQLGVKVYMKLLLIVDLTFCHIKKSQSKVRCLNITTFTNITGCLQMGKPTIS
jgi:hypothetical protein